MTATPTNTGLVVRSIANAHASGGADVVEEEFRRLKGVEAVTEFLQKAGFDPAQAKYNLAIISQFHRTTTYPVISAVLADAPHGVRFRYKPQAPICKDNRNHTGFVVRLSPNGGVQIPLDVLALRLKVTASRMYGASDDVDTQDVIGGGPVLVETTLAAVRALLDFNFTSNDLTEWARAVAKEVGPKEDMARWKLAIKELIRQGRLVWSDTTGLSLPTTALPARIADVVPAATPTSTGNAPNVSTGEHTLVDDLQVLLDQLGTFRATLAGNKESIIQAEKDVTTAAAEVARLQTALAMAQTQHTQAVGILAARKAKQAEAANSVDPEILLAVASRLEAGRKTEAVVVDDTAKPANS